MPWPCLLLQPCITSRPSLTKAHWGINVLHWEWNVSESINIYSKWGERDSLSHPFTIKHLAKPLASSEIWSWLVCSFAACYCQNYSSAWFHADKQLFLWDWMISWPKPIGERKLSNKKNLEIFSLSVNGWFRSNSPLG